jgi:hypothetical protein
MSKAKTLKRGDAWTTKDRLWMVVDSKGRPDWYASHGVSVFRKRAEAIEHIESHGLDEVGYRVVRLSDLSGIVQ